MRDNRPKEVVQRLRAKVSHWANQSIEKRPSEKLFQATMQTEIAIENPDDVRCGEVVTVPVYESGTFGELLDRGSQSVRLWEGKGTLPPPIIKLAGQEKGHFRRGYTYDQLKVVYDLIPLSNFKDKRGLPYTLFSRELHRRWAQMPDGVVPVLDEKPRVFRGIESQIVIDAETLGEHRLIAYETGVVPMSCSFRRRERNASDRELVVTVRQRDLEPEHERPYPPFPGNPEELFPERRKDPYTVEQFEKMLDELLLVPFTLIVQGADE